MVHSPPMVSTALPPARDAFIARWDGTERAERANYQQFLSELCDVLGVRRPEPATGSGAADRFGRGVTHYEADAVGFYLSAHSLDSYGPALKRLGAVPSREIEERARAGAGRVRLARIVGDVKLRTTSTRSRILKTVPNWCVR
ncbi:MAG: hypothetical protein JO157_05535 [Acetobacteraceae bacterium]|nr:hypothetical protein [Acetobacteraceae bacterium]